MSSALTPPNTNSSMQFILKQKDHDVALIQWNPELARPLRLLEINEKRRLPLPVLYNDGQGMQSGLNDWIEARSVPDARFQRAKTKALLFAQNRIELSFKCLGLSLSDSYWFCPINESLSWSDVNLFKNDFDTFFVSKKKSSRIRNPFASTNGELEKFWKVENGIRVLYKESLEPYFQQAYNEAFASIILDKLEIPHVPYTIQLTKDVPYSVCPAFTDENTEYVPAWYVHSAAKKHGNESEYHYFTSCAAKVCSDFDSQKLNTILAFDYLICNSDRHYGNFGFLRDVETLEWKGMAPIFDNGTSLWHKTLTRLISRSEQSCKPFFRTFDMQLAFLNSSLPDFPALSDDFIRQTASDVFSQNPLFDKARINAISKAVILGNNQLHALQREAEIPPHEHAKPPKKRRILSNQR